RASPSVRRARLGSIRPDNVHSCFASLAEAGTNPTMSQKSGARFTGKQGLAFIHTYAHMFGRPPAEADIQRHFRVSPPSVHQMIVTLERNGFIRRQPGVPEASKSSCRRKACRSSNGSASKRQNHRDESLALWCLAYWNRAAENAAR